MVVTPLYAGLREKFPDIGPDELSFALPLGIEQISATVATLRSSEKLTVYFIDQPEYYQRARQQQRRQ